MLYNSENPHGGDIYSREISLDFSANINMFGTPKGVIDAIEAALPEICRYPDPHCGKLVSAISEFEKVPPNHILCGNGAAELIYSFCNAIKPSVAAEIAPTFSEYSLALGQTNSVVKRFLTNSENDFEVTEEFINFLSSEKPDAVFLCNPNNPTGRIIPSRILENVLEFCSENQIRLFADECFMDLSDGKTSLVSYTANHKMLCVLKAFTKSYGLAGVRLGYCISSDAELFEKMSKTVQPWNVSSVAQYAGIAALEEREFLAKTKAVIKKEREYLALELEKLGFRVCKSEVNFLLFKGYRRLDDYLEKMGISIRNCANFNGLSDEWYRIAVRTHKENEILISAIKNNGGR